MKIKIFLADDQYLMLEGLKAILKHEPEIEVVGTARDGYSALDQVIKLQPDLVLIDIEMPRMNGIVATKYICENMPDTKVIVLTSHKKSIYITKALQAGASGYLLKNTLIQDLKLAIHALGKGYFYNQGKLTTPRKHRISTTNILKYQEKITYFKKYRKSIYIPPSNSFKKIIRQQITKKLFHHNPSHSGITKASLAPVFESPTASESSVFVSPSPKNNTINSTPKFNRKRYLRRIVLMLIAIASFILSIIIF